MTLPGGAKTSLSDGDHKTRSCSFCKRQILDSDFADYGKTEASSRFTAHYYCVLLASWLPQRGDDDEGIRGFLDEDIARELKRCCKNRCSYCHSGGATVRCAYKDCRVLFHYPCGFDAGAVPNFDSEHFYVYCTKHAPSHTKEILARTSDTLVECSICLQPLDLTTLLTGNKRSKCDFFISPCCGRFYEKRCLRHYALVAGLHHFRCCQCRNDREFVSACRQHGTFVPDQDAEWELGDQFADHYRLHDRCDMPCCLSPHGRHAIEDDSEWSVSRCEVCGKSGTHIKCSNLPDTSDPGFVCVDCNIYSISTKDDLLQNGCTANFLSPADNCCSNIMWYQRSRLHLTSQTEDLIKYLCPVDHIAANEEDVEVDDLQAAQDGKSAESTSLTKSENRSDFNDALLKFVPQVRTSISIKKDETSVQPSTALADETCYKRNREAKLICSPVSRGMNLQAEPTSLGIPFRRLQLRKEKKWSLLQLILYARNHSTAEEKERCATLKLQPEKASPRRGLIANRPQSKLAQKGLESDYLKQRQHIVSKLMVTKVESISKSGTFPTLMAKSSRGSVLLKQGGFLKASPHQRITLLTKSPSLQVPRSFEINQLTLRSPSASHSNYSMSQRQLVTPSLLLSNFPKQEPKNPNNSSVGNGKRSAASIGVRNSYTLKSLLSSALSTPEHPKNAAALRHFSCTKSSHRFNVKFLAQNNTVQFKPLSTSHTPAEFRQNSPGYGSEARGMIMLPPGTLSRKSEYLFDRRAGQNIDNLHSKFCESMPESKSDCASKKSASNLAQGIHDNYLVSQEQWSKAPVNMPILKRSPQILDYSPQPCTQASSDLTSIKFKHPTSSCKTQNSSSWDRCASSVQAPKAYNRILETDSPGSSFVRTTANSIQSNKPSYARSRGFKINRCKMTATALSPQNAFPYKPSYANRVAFSSNPNSVTTIQKTTSRGKFVDQRIIRHATPSNGRLQPSFKRRRHLLKNGQTSIEKYLMKL